ncbi:hypothetical protein HMPREF9120_02520 [Neisseria sp. oral taxon 020 str. F0370]|nr:hypothetical protein HMPREF9120_02520 [Neisseria sp. oral taxon 020 str. F0370]
MARGFFPRIFAACAFQTAIRAKPRLLRPSETGINRSFRFQTAFSDGLSKG